jgi:hypothetical protein
MPAYRTQPAKRYLGDAVYAAWENRGVVCLTTENGIRATNTIILEPEVWRNLLDFLGEEKI